MSDRSGTPYPKTCALIERAGVDPNAVAIFGLTPWSYLAFRYRTDRPGRQKVVAKSRAVTDRRSWPEGWGWRIWSTFEIERGSRVGRVLSGLLP